MKKNLYVLVLLVLLYSCKKTAENTTVEVPVTDKVSEISVTGPRNSNSISVVQGDPTYNFLGYGYDITGKYADTSSVRSVAINIPEYIVHNPGRFDYARNITSSAQVIMAANAEDFSRQLSTRLNESNGMKYFKGSITSSFPTQGSLSKKYMYGNYTYFMTYKMLKMDVVNIIATNYLTPGFSTDIQGLSAAALVAKYGTHILAQIMLGAKFNVTYQAETSASNFSEVSKAGFTYAMKKVFGLSTGVVDPINMTDLQSISTAKIVYEGIGSDITKLSIDSTSKTTTVNISKWSEGSTDKNIKFIDILQNGLVPLYDLINDPLKKAEVKKYITQYLLDQQVKLVD